MPRVIMIFGYPGAGKTHLSDIIRKTEETYLFHVDNYLEHKIFNEDVVLPRSSHQFKDDRFGNLFYQMLVDIEKHLTKNSSSNILIDAPLITIDRRTALFDVLSRHSIESITLYQLECRDFSIWEHRIKNKDGKIDAEVFKSYREKYESFSLDEYKFKDHISIHLISIDTSSSKFDIKDIILCNSNITTLNLALSLIGMKESAERTEYDLENYKMLTAYISDLNKRTDLYIKLNLTLFIAVITFIFSNLPNPMIKFAFLPLSLINWISYKYFDANNNLLVTMQAHLAGSYEQDMNEGWYKKSLAFRDSKPDEKKKKKHFSPINFYGFLIIFSAACYTLISLVEIYPKIENLRIDFSLPIDGLLTLNIVLLIAFAIGSTIAASKIISYPDWPSNFKERYERFLKLKNNKT